MAGVLLNSFQQLGLFLLVSEPTGLFGFFCSLFFLCSITWWPISCSSSYRESSSVATSASFSPSSSLGARKGGDVDLAASWICPLPLPFAPWFLILRLGGIMKLWLNWQKIYYPSPQVRLVRSVIVLRTFCPFLIWYICVLSVIHLLLIRQSPLVDHSLSVTCLLHMRYSCVLCAPYTFGDDYHRHRDDFHHRMSTGITIFAFFLSVQRPCSYPVICDSTITVINVTSMT